MRWAVLDGHLPAQWETDRFRWEMAGGQLPNEYLKVLSYNVLMDYNSEVAQYPLGDVLYTEFRWCATLGVMVCVRS